MTSAPFVLPCRPEVTRLRHVDAAALLHPTKGRTQPMRGFEDTYTDIVDYILRITHRIWVNRAVGYIYDTYDANCVVYSALGTIRSVEDVVANTLQSIAASGDGESHHLHVTWSGDEDQGFYTSHLGWSLATNTGPTMFGPATGKRIGRFFVADCISANNRIHTEWLMRDNGAMVRQMGRDPHEVAQQLASAPASESSYVAVPTRLDGQAPRPVYDGPVDTPQGWAARHFDLWNARRFDLLAEHYAPGVIAHWCSGQTAQGRRGALTLVMRLLASLPTGTVRIDHVSWAEETDGAILAVRWMLEGWTRPGGMLGNVPVGKPAAILGATHLRFQGGLIVEEWNVFDEIGTLVQIYRA